MATRTLHVIVCETGEPFDVATWDGLAHAELLGAVARCDPDRAATVARTTPSCSGVAAWAPSVA